MHYTLTVALPGDIPDYALREALDRTMEFYSEHREVAPHRDTSVYVERFADQLAKAKGSAAEKRDDWTLGLTDAEIVEHWNGDTDFDADGWPMTTSNPDGTWDWWVVGGRWGGAWHLRDGAESGPLRSDNHAFGREERADEPNRTDNARWRDIVPESVESTFAWINLAGEWHHKWIGPTREEALSPDFPEDTSHWRVPEAEHAAGFMKFLANLPGDAWLVHIDYHN